MEVIGDLGEKNFEEVVGVICCKRLLDQGRDFLFYVEDPSPRLRAEPMFECLLEIIQ